MTEGWKVGSLAYEIARVRQGRDITSTDLAERLAPWLAAHDREVAAAALDKASDAFNVHGRSRGEAIAANTLRASAAAIREGDHVVE